jgi:membrane protein
MFGTDANWKTFARDLKNEVSEDNISNGAAALAFYLILAIFPAMIFLLSLLPYLPIANLDRAMMDFLRQALPSEAANMFTGVVESIVSSRRGGLLSFGLVATLWAASSGIYAIMQQLNITYDVKESRSLLKVRGLALLLMLIFGGLMIGAFALVVLGGEVQGWLAANLGWGQALRSAFALLRWIVIALMITLAFATVYYLGPDVEQEFKFITPGSVFGTVVIVAATLLFNWYVANFANYSATYGSIGAVIILMMWLYISGFVLLLGAETNALFEHYYPAGKEKGERRVADRERRPSPVH